MSDSNDDLRAERERLQAEIARLQVSRDTGVPVSVLGDAATVEDAQALAERALAWKAAAQAAQPPATAAAPAYSGAGQISRETLKNLTPQQVNQVYAENRLAGIGAPAPPPRRTGEQHRNAAP